MTELEQKKADLETARLGIQDPRLDDDLKQAIQIRIEALEDEIRTLEAQGATTKTSKPKRSAAAPKPATSTAEESVFLKSLTSTIESLLKSNEGTALDTPSVRNIIATYLKDDKVKLSELDQSVLDEIKKNQIKVLEIPAFGKKIEVSESVAKIPNFFEIIDDVLAGNNVYLIGEAGGGKTYTAKAIAKALQREYVTLNCSQFTSPLEILGGQSVEGFKEGKLINCWRDGKILLLDEMPKLDANTAGLLNDALAQSSKTQPSNTAFINSANASEPPIQRNDNFAVIATGNVYPNEPVPSQYRGNNQQDLSLLDRFSGSVYYVEFDNFTDQTTTRFKFLYDFLIGNYYEYIRAKSTGGSLPTPVGLRTGLEATNNKQYALVSYRTNIAFRVGFEYELVREIAKRQGIEVNEGKTFLKTFQSYMVAFRSNRTVYDDILTKTSFTDAYINNLVKTTIDSILADDMGFFNSLNDSVAKSADPMFKRYKDFYVAQTAQIPTKP